LPALYFPGAQGIPEDTFKGNPIVKELETLHLYGYFAVGKRLTLNQGQPG
jgi:hypothetical protein